MQNKSENFNSDIHTVDYESEYERRTVTSDMLIRTTSREEESLNGMWHFHEDWYQTNLRAHWYKAPLTSEDGRDLPVDFDFLSWPVMRVPSCWNTEREELKYFEGSGLYARTFAYKEKEQGERVFLHFEGAAYRTTVFLNQKFVGLHDGGSTPFTIDVTPYLKEENMLLVDVDGRRKAERVPSENTDWFAYGGLYRSVSLIRTPKTFIKDWFVRLKDGKVKLDATLNDDSDGKGIFSIKETNYAAEVTFKDGKCSMTFQTEVPLWSPDDPALTTVSLSYGNDNVTERIGWRECKAVGNDICLNSRKVFLKGTCVHEDHPVLGKCTTDEMIRDTIRTAKELHCNYIRLAHYPHSRRFSEIADEMGIMLWEEVPVYWAIAFENPKTYADAENQLSELIKRDRNRASVIIWSVGNENADTDARFVFMRNLAKKAHELDDSRMVSAACLVNPKRMMIQDRLADELDVIGLNEYCGWYDPEYDHLRQILENSNPKKPVIIAEFGAGARQGYIGKEGELFSEENQKSLYEKQFAIQKKCRFIAGISPWILYDFRCPRRFNRWQEGYNRKGVIDANHLTRKLAFEVLKKHYEEN